MDYNKEIGLYYLRYAFFVLSSARLNGGQCNLEEYSETFSATDREVFFSEILPKFGAVEWRISESPGSEGHQWPYRFTLSAEGEAYAEKVVQILKEMSPLLNNDAIDKRLTEEDAYYGIFGSDDFPKTPLIRHLTIRAHQEWTREKLWFFSKVEKITIEGDFQYDDDSCDNFCKGLPWLYELEVRESDTFFVEDGALYAYFKEGARPEFGRFYDLPADLAGKVLVAIPTLYPKKDFRVAEGTRAVCIGAFCGMSQIESITFPDSIEYISICALSSLTNLKKLHIPNKTVYMCDQNDLGPKPELICTNPDEQLSPQTIKSWHFWWD